MSRSKSPASLAFGLPKALADAAMSELTPTHRKALKGKHTSLIMQHCLEASARIVEIVEAAVIEDDKQGSLGLEGTDK